MKYKFFTLKELLDNIKELSINETKTKNYI